MSNLGNRKHLLKSEIKLINSTRQAGSGSRLNPCEMKESAGPCHRARLSFSFWLGVSLVNSDARKYQPKKVNIDTPIDTHHHVTIMIC